MFCISHLVIFGFLWCTTEAAKPCSLRSSPPKGLTCGISGETKAGAYEASNGPQFVGSLEKCALLCAHRSIMDCKSFYYDSTTRKCGLSTSAVAGQVNKTEEENPLYYDALCFKCRDRCGNQPVDGGNLLDNGDFSLRRLSPWYAPDRGHEYNPPPPGGSGRSLRLGYGAESSVSQIWNPCVGSTYAFVFDWKARARSSYSYYGFYFQASPTSGYFNPYHLPENNFWGYFTSDAGKNPSTSWRRVYGFKKEVGYDVNEFTLTGIPSHDYTGVTNFSVADVGIYHLPDPAHMKIKPNSDILENGGFETGSVSPWGTTGSIVSPGIKGKYAVQLKGDFGLAQDLKVKPDTVYLLRFDMNVLKTDKQQYYLVILFDYLEGGRNHLNIAEGPRNYSYAVPLATPDKKATLQLNLGVNGYNSGHYDLKVVIDNVRLEEVVGLPYPFNKAH